MLTAHRNVAIHGVGGLHGCATIASRPSSTNRAGTKESAADVVRIISADSHVDIQQERVLANLPPQYHGALRGQMRAPRK